jgi:hypothetical protein
MINRIVAPRRREQPIHLLQLLLFADANALKILMAHKVPLCICALPPALCNTARPNCLQQGKLIGADSRSTRPTGPDHLAFE